MGYVSVAIGFEDTNPRTRPARVSAFLIYTSAKILFGSSVGYAPPTRGVRAPPTGLKAEPGSLARLVATRDDSDNCLNSIFHVN
jgi:hypothetical protein